MKKRDYHGGSKTSLYFRWHQMIQRCHNPRSRSFVRYGAKGVTVCERWRESFANFLADMGDPPTDRHTIDRIDSAGNYEPANCRWATPYSQNRNKKTNIMVTHDGLTMCLKDWAKHLNMSYQTLHSRISKLGLDPVTAVAHGSLRLPASLAKQYRELGRRHI